MPGTIHFLLTGDKKYTNQIIVTMTSIIKNMIDSKLFFHIFVGGMNHQDCIKLKSIKKISECSVEIYHMEEHEHYFDRVRPEESLNSHVSKAGNYRLLMTEILPNTVSKCFYVDCDIIVDTDLSKIYYAMKEEEIAAVVSEIGAMEYREDMLIHWYEWEEFSKFVAEPTKYPHFNDGFFLLNVDLARRKGMFSSILEFISKHDFIPYTDQDILNAVIGQDRPGELRILPPHYDVFWNTDHYREYTRSCYPPELIRDSFENPKVIHFCGSWKPWDCGGWPHYDLWWKYAEMSPVADEFFGGDKRRISDVSHDAMRYRYGWDVDIDLQKSFDCFMEVVRNGIGHAVPYAIDVAKELGNIEGLRELIPYAESEAEKGNGDCAVRLGQAYRDGYGVERDIDRAVYWMKKAYDLKIFWCKPEFFDVMKWRCDDLQRAMFEVASSGAKDGNAMSMVHLGRCYRDGIGTDVDATKAREWISRGMDAGADWAKPELDSFDVKIKRGRFWKK